MRHLILALVVVGGLFAGPLAAGRAANGASAADSAAYRLLDEAATGSYDVSTSVRATGAGEARVCFGYRDARNLYYVRVTNRSVSLMRVSDGKAVPLAPAVSLKPALGADAVSLVVKRRPEKVSLVLRGVSILTVGDLDAGGGKVGVASSGGGQAEEPSLQLVESPAFTDDFMREAGEAGNWETPLARAAPDKPEMPMGQWSTTTIGDVNKSANGFAYRGSGTPAFCVTGYRFWDDYALQASVRCTQDDGSVGLCVYYQDPKNYLGVEWTSAEGLCLIRVLDGTRTLLARKPLAWVPNQWYRLSLQALDGRLTAFIDGKVCLETGDDHFGRGKVALYVKGKEVLFDDIAVKPAVFFRQSPPFAHKVEWLPAGDVRVVGSQAWQDYTCRARFTPVDKSGLGLVFGWCAPGNYYAFEWTPDAKRIVHVAGAKRSVVAESPGGFQLKQRYDVDADFRPGYVSVAIDGKRVLECADSGLSHGAVGLSPLSASVQELAVTLREEPPPPEEEITKEFTITSAHPDMAEWANPAKAWMAHMSDNGIVFWRKGEFFGDTTVHLPIPQMGKSGRVFVALGADGTDPQSGYTFTLQRPESDKLAVQLQRGTTAVADATAPLPKEGDKVSYLTMARTGSVVTVDLNGKRILERPAESVPGTRIAMRVRDVEMDLKEVQVRSRNVYDYTFHDAPTDWSPQAGIWEVTNRWSCSPGWSWFGGKTIEPGRTDYTPLAAIWNKRRFSGDLVLEYYAGPKMDAVAEAYTERFRDLNATICADGERLNSGYSFIIDGWHLDAGDHQRRRTAILKGSRVVAETQSFHLPEQKTGHRQWFYIRIEKHGSRITLSVDNEKWLSWEDPEPLTGDRVALWTQNNGLMLARVVLSYQQEEEIALVGRDPVPPAAQTVVAPPPEATRVPMANDFEKGMGQWRGATARLALDAGSAAEGHKSLRITNALPGGDFRTVAVAGPFDVAQARHLSFDYRMPPDVRVNVYVRVDAQSWYSITFTGRGATDLTHGVVGSLGKFENVERDDRWHHASFDLLSALRRYFPTQNPLMVREIVFANWDNLDEYVLAGVTENSIGAIYRVDGFALGSGAAATANEPAPKPVAVKPPAPKPTAVKPPAPKPTAVKPPAPKLVTVKPPAPKPVAIQPPAPKPVAVRPAPKPTSAVPSPPAAGKVAPPPKPTVVAQRTAPAATTYRVALADPFTAGKTPVRWDAMEGKWEVNRDGLFAPTEKAEYAYAFTGDANWSDYFVKADLVNGKDAGICVRAQDWNNCVFLVIRPAHRDLFWFVRRNGEWGGVLSPTALEIDVKPVIHLKVSVIDDTYVCYLDGKIVSQIKDTTFRRGRVGLYIHPAETGQAWNDFAIIIPERDNPSRAIADRR